MRREIYPTGQFPQRQVQRFQRNDPFQHIQQMMMSFGGLNQDPFLNGLMGFGGRDSFQDMFNFSDIHKNVHNRGVQGSYVMQSFVSSSKIGPDGRVITQNYFENNMGQHRGGNTISQKQQAYKNSQGTNRIAEQRMLNDRGRKIIREKVGKNYQETNHYYNIDEEQAPKFDSDWRQINVDQKFLESMNNYIQANQNQQNLSIGYQTRQNISQHAPRAGEYPRQQQRIRQNYGQTQQRPLQISHRPPQSSYRPPQSSYRPPEYHNTGNMRSDTTTYPPNNNINFRRY